ncbi:MAG: alpha/beta hydrolase [Gammaproteobacteria bacterium]
MNKRSPSQNEFVTLSSQLIAEKDPQAASMLAEKLWRMTYRSKIPDEEITLLDRSSQEAINFNSRVLNTYTWGTGTPALLIHGWNGRAGQMAEIASAMADAGFKAIALDLPAHGNSSGDETDLLEIISAIQFLNQTKGPFHSVIAHSFGGIGLFKALQQGMAAERVVCISTPAHIETLLNKFTSTFNLSEQVFLLVKERLEMTYGVEFWDEYSMQTMSSNIDIPGLLIHDSKDEYVGIESMFEINAAWPTSTVLPTQDLGHTKILNDPAVIQAITQFVLR